MSNTVQVPTGGRSPAEWWRGLRPPARWLIGAGAALLAFNAGLAGLETATGGSGPTGPTSSSYATSSSGLAAFADLVGGHGHPVRRLRQTLDRVGLDAGATLVLADVSGGAPAELEAVARFVAAGGRLVVAGAGAFEILEALAGGAPAPGGERATPARPLAAVPEVAGVREVVGRGDRSFAPDTGPALPVLGSRRAVLAAVAVIGRGRLVVVADVTPWQNRLLDEADNAAFALAAVGEQGRPVLFAEAPHGYGPSRGLAGFPSAWKWAALVALVAVVTAMWAKGRRLGPPEELERELGPPRRAYVDALAGTIARTRQPAEAMAPLQVAARRRLLERAGLAPDAQDDDLRRAAARALARLEGAER